MAPFQEKLSWLAADPAPPVRVALIATNAEALQAFLSEILGQDYNVCKVVIPARLGFSEIVLQERGFLLDAGAGPREFDDAGSFLSALEQTHAIQQSGSAESLEPLRVKLKAPAHLNGLCLLVPHSLDALVQKPALLSSLADQADWVFLVGGPGTEFTTPQRSAVQLLLDHVAGMQSIQFAPAPPDTAAAPAPADGWWRGWKVGLSLGLVRLGSDLLRTRLALLTGPTSELRLYLVESRLLRQLDMTFGLMSEEVQQEQRKLTNRLNLAREGLSAGEGPADSRKTAEAIRNRFTEEIDSLLKAAEREAKASVQAEGEAVLQLQAAADSLTPADIEQTEGEATVKLTLAPAASARLTETVLKLARQRLSTELRQLHEGLECSVADAKRAVEAAVGARPSVTLELPDETSLWETISNLARPEIRYRGEMPRATLGARFNAARQLIMGMMIVGTIFGGVTVLTGDQSGSQGIRSYLAAFMLPLLVIGFLWTYVSFRKKERLTLEKEVEKLRDGVLGDLRRVLQELHREQTTIAGGAVQKVSRSVQQQLDGAFERLDRQRQRDSEESRRRQAEQQRSIDQRLARVRQFTGQISTLHSNLKEADRSRAQWLAAWIDRFNQGKA